jgi:putative transposase
MLMKRDHTKRTAQEKEKILIDIQSIGPVAGCRKYGISKSLYYIWLNKYNVYGIEGLESFKMKQNEQQRIRLEKENAMLKQLLAEKELESKMKDDLLKKKIAQWNKGNK